LTRRTGPTGLRVVVNPEGRRVGVTATRLRDACTLVLRAERVRAALVSITLLSRRRRAVFNRKDLGRSGSTDVIAFGFRDPLGALIGDVYLCPDEAALNARTLGVPVREEILRTAVHGTLHVLGYDHPEGASRTASTMWKRQERYLARSLSSR
jgi:probable rRNA maturation factor